jgi:hypothetical protein
VRGCTTYGVAYLGVDGAIEIRTERLIALARVACDNGLPIKWGG